MWAEIHLHNNKFLVAVAYRPPNSSVSFWDDLQVSYDLAYSSSTDKIILMGDLNADFQTNHGKKLNSFCTSNNLTLHINEPTRITDRTATCLDQIITNVPSFVKDEAVLPPVADNDHCTVAANLLFRHKKNSSFQRFIWLYAKADFDVFRDSLSEVDWDPCFDTDDVDEMCKLWTSTFLNVARQNIPNRAITVRDGDAPWYNSRLRAQKRKVDRIHRKAKSTRHLNNAHIWHYFRALRNQYISDLRAAEEDYFNRQFDIVNKSKRKEKRWWKTVNHFLKGSQDSSNSHLLVDDIVISDNQSKAAALNSFFLKQSRVDSSTFHCPPMSTQSISGNILDNLTISEDDIYSVLASLDVSKASGPDGISPILLKEAAPSVAPSLAKLFNLSLEKKAFPYDWKKANVTPILKKGDPSLCSNYRPISLLSCVAKVFERVIFKYVFNFLRDNFALSEKQSGFMPGDGTVNQLVYLYHEFAKAVDLQKEVRVVFL